MKAKIKKIIGGGILASLVIGVFVFFWIIFRNILAPVSIFVGGSFLTWVVIKSIDLLESKDET